MVSRKKAKGKARRAVKEAKAEEAQEGAQEQKALEAQLQRLTINNLVRESGDCSHGFEVEGRDLKLCLDFIKAFRGGYDAKWDSGDHSIMSCLNAGVAAIEKEDKLAAMWNDAAGMKKLVSYVVWEGTHCILVGDPQDAGLSASHVFFFEQNIAVRIEKTKPMVISWHGAAELQNSDLHTLVKFFRKRIPCKCLDLMYKRVKSVTKMGLCSNVECFLSGKKVAQSEMFYCDRCREACYCSVECQTAHWPRHKKWCKRVACERAEFYAKQQLL